MNNIPEWLYLIMPVSAFAVYVVGVIWIITCVSSDYELEPLWVLGVLLGLIPAGFLTIWSSESILGFVVATFYNWLLGWQFLLHKNRHARASHSSSWNYR